MKPLTTLIALALLALLPSSASAIVGGHEARAGSYPFMVQLVTAGNSPKQGGYCGGTLIAPSVVLTAAHCLVNQDWKGHFDEPESITVLVGTTFRGSGTLLNVSAIIIHPKYDKPSFRYDAALLILDGDATTYGARPAPLVTASPRSGTLVSAAGWGDMDVWDSLADPAHLRSVSLHTTTASGCRKAIPELYSPSMLCAYAPGRDTCTYDSGGPLVAGGKLVGITSTGFGCAVPGYPGIYTRVSAIRAWALSTIDRNSA